MTLILSLAGIGGFLLAQRYLLDQWTESAHLKLEKSAHETAMRLNAILQLMDQIAKTGQVPHQGDVSAFLMKQLELQEGVISVKLHSETGEPSQRTGRDHASGWSHDGIVDGFQLRLDLANKAVELATTVPGNGERLLEQLTVAVGFDSFLPAIQDIVLSGDSSACLITADGHYIAHTEPSMHHKSVLGDEGDTLGKGLLNAIKLQEHGVVLGKGYPPDVVTAFYHVPSTDFYVVIFAKGSSVFGPIIAFSSYYLIGSVVSLFSVFLSVRAVTTSVSRSVEEMSNAAARLVARDYSIRLDERRSDELGQLNRSFNSMAAGLSQRDLIQKTFGRYIDKSIAEELLKTADALTMGGRKKLVTILMADPGNFQVIASGLEPEEVVRMLNKYLAGMIRMVESYKGIVVDFFGGGLLAFFDRGDDYVSEGAGGAVECALGMQQEFQESMKKNGTEHLPVPELRIGVHTGWVVVGNIGAETRTKYGIVGSAVNVTERIKSAAQPGTVLVSDETYRFLGTRLHAGAKVRVRLKGVGEEKNLYRVESIDARNEMLYQHDGLDPKLNKAK